MTRRLSLPGPFADPDWRPTFVRWSIVGGLIRLLLLPIGITTDTLAVYWRSHLIAFHGEVFSDYLVNMGSHAVHAAWLRLVQPLLGSADSLWTHPWWWSDTHALAPRFLEELLARPDALRAIALLKVPYVLADLAAGLILLALVWPTRDPRRSGAEAGSREERSDDGAGVRRVRRAWIFWMLSPAVLYATLVFGRYETFPVVAILGALLLAERDRPWWAALALGVGITLRTYPLVLVPVFALCLYRDLPRQVGWTVVAVLPFAVTMGINRIVGDTFGELESVGEYSFGNNWFAFALRPDTGPGVYVFVAAMLGIGAYLLGRDRGWWGEAPVARTDLWRWLVVAHLALFAFSQFSAHYLAWITPAIALLLARTPRRGIVPLHLAQVAGVFAAVFVLYGGVLFTGALGGLGPTARDLLPQTRFLSQTGAQQVADVAWTAFVVATLALLVPFLRDTVIGRSARVTKPTPRGDGRSAGRR